MITKFHSPVSINMALENFCKFSFTLVCIRLSFTKHIFMKLKLMVALLGFIIISSCQKRLGNPDPTTSHANQWRWAWSSGGIGGVRVIPASSLIFLSLNNDSTYTVQLDNDIIQRGTYSTTQGPTRLILHFDKPVNIENLHMKIDQGMVTSSTLMLELLDENISDGFLHHFDKVGNLLDK